MVRWVSQQEMEDDADRQLEEFMRLEEEWCSPEETQALFDEVYAEFKQKGIL